MKLERFVLLPLVALMLAACGGTPQTTTEFTLSATPSSLKITAGHTTNPTLNLTRLNGFAGPVTVSLSGPPAGVTANPTTIDAASSTGLIAVAVSGAVVAGDYVLNLIASGGNSSQSLNVPLSVVKFVPGQPAPLPAKPTTTVVSRIPADASNVSASSPISVTFSAAMETATVAVTVSTAQVLKDLGPPVWTNSDKTVTFNPASDLAHSSTYVLTVTGKDAGGKSITASSSTFTTTAGIIFVPIDVTPPTVVSRIPANGAIKILTSTKFSLTFSEPMDKKSVGMGVATPNASNFQFGINPVWSNGDKTVTFSTLNPLVPNLTYIIEITAKDVAGNSLAQSPSTFST